MSPCFRLSAYQPLNLLVSLSQTHSLPVSTYFRLSISQSLSLSVSQSFCLSNLLSLSLHVSPSLRLSFLFSLLEGLIINVIFICSIVHFGGYYASKLFSNKTLIINKISKSKSPSLPMSQSHSLSVSTSCRRTVSQSHSLSVSSSVSLYVSTSSCLDVSQSQSLTVAQSIRLHVSLSLRLSISSSLSVSLSVYHSQSLTLSLKISTSRFSLLERLIINIIILFSSVHFGGYYVSKHFSNKTLISNKISIPINSIGKTRQQL